MEYSQEFQHKLLSAKASYNQHRSYVLEKLREWYAEGGYTSPGAFRTALKVIGYVCPILTLDGITGELIIKAGSMQVLFNTRVCYTESFTTDVYSTITCLGTSPDGLPIYVTRDTHAETTRYHDGEHEYSLQYWIAFGRICPECGRPFGHYGRDLCSTCHEVNEPMPYSARAEDELGHEDTKDHKFGIELEYEGVTALQVKKTIPKHAIAKRDGTICNGVEVVTRPACASTHKKEMQVFFDAVNTVASSNTGMHIHIDKKNLSEYRVGFMLWFFNHPSNREVLTVIAGRDFAQNSYCRTRHDTTMTSHLVVGSRFKEVSRSATDKYTPFNTRKGKTYEVRIFRSPESHLEMCAKLDFLRALMDYSSPYSVSVKSLKDKVDINNFIAFAKKNRKDYPDFYEYFKPTLFAA